MDLQAGVQPSGLGFLMPRGTPVPYETFMEIDPIPNVSPYSYVKGQKAPVKKTGASARRAKYSGTVEADIPF